MVPDHTFECLRFGTEVLGHHLSGHLRVVGSSPRLGGSLSEAVDVTSQATGNSVGQVTVQYSLDVSR